MQRNTKHIRIFNEFNQNFYSGLMNCLLCECDKRIISIDSSKNCYHAATACFQNNLYPVTFINFQMTAYMQSQLAINQCNYFGSIVSLYSILYNLHAWRAKYKSLFRVYFNLFRIKNERMRQRKRLVNRRVSIKVYRWYRWPHFRSASNFAEIQPLPSETNVKLNCFHTT